jgi:hypothetical protein
MKAWGCQRCFHQIVVYKEVLYNCKTLSACRTDHTEMSALPDSGKKTGRHSLPVWTAALQAVRHDLPAIIRRNRSPSLESQCHLPSFRRRKSTKRY